MALTRRSSAQKAHSASQMRRISDRRLAKENYQPYHIPPPIRTYPRLPLGSASDAHPNAQHAQDKRKQELNGIKKMLAEAKRDIRNGRRREKRAREKVGSLQRAEENRCEDERIRTKHTVQAIREEEQTKATIHFAAAREAQQMELEALLQATQVGEQVRATALIAAAHKDARRSKTTRKA
ncbi:hypothetical protein BD311DRAFT_818799 [Dichomitus squalens]|uniref:Uncharacterized protein n=1 Tax=Dichomitus squalens TaxID=114155 RepID=A0A4Q9MVF0_9APHY|nr:hypothetical protein BD311DRAFT_818799 [Dichomitus squalens]